ncbi:ATP-binding protein [Enterococcus gilvus]|uniref:sensor histidine kinase n=1 Tax=Enterococcus gilvus TaxID=160453 RepID=UPI003ED86125
MDILDKNINKIVVSAKYNQDKKLKRAADKFMIETEIIPIILDENNSVYYMPSFNFGETGLLDQSQELNSEKATPVTSAQVIKNFSFKNKKYTVVYSPNIKTVNYNTQVLIKFSFYFLLFTIFLSFFVAYIFSKKVVEPLQKMNQIAKNMVNLDFSSQLEIDSDDELGELSNNLNRLGESLNKALIELEKQNNLLIMDLKNERELEHTRKIFFTAISHQLKSPLATAMGIIEAMKYNIYPYNNHEEYLTKAYEVLEGMAQLIQEMLTVSEIEETSEVFSKKKVDLNKQLRLIVKSLKKNPEFKHQTISWSLEEPLYIKTNLQLLQKCLQNILNNAFLYSSEKGEIRITTKSERNGTWYCSVFNTSSPISHKELSRLFEPFYRIEKSGNKKTGGSGLGLFLTKQFLTRLNISFELKNTKDGILFELWSSE